MFRATAAGLATALYTSAAVASPTPIPPMTFQLVRSASFACAPECPEWIAAEGAIVPGTARSFRALLARLDRRRRPILIQSPGGAIDDALDMGRLIRANGLAVAVARTLRAPGASSDPTRAVEGTAVAFPAYCFSACAFVLAAGVERYANPSAVIGVHQTIEKLSQVMVYRRFLIRYRTVNGRKQEISREQISENRKTIASTLVSPPAVNARVAAYFREMGEDPDIVALMQSATPQEIHAMSTAELEDTRLVSVWINDPLAMHTARDDNGLAGVPVKAGAGGGAVLLAGQTWSIPPAGDGSPSELSVELSMRRGGAGVTATFARSGDATGFRFAVAPDGPDNQDGTHIYAAGDFCRLAQVGVLDAGLPTQAPTQAPGEPDPRAPWLRVRFGEVDGMRRLTEELCGGAPASRK
jgi:hypothetical protein